MLEHLREEFPAPESDPGPQLPDEDRSGQVRFDLRQQFGGLVVQPIGVRQQPVIHDLLLRDEPSRPLHSHVPPVLGPPRSCLSAKRKARNERVPLYLMPAVSCCESRAAQVTGHNPAGRQAITVRKCVTLIELRKAVDAARQLRSDLQRAGHRVTSHCASCARRDARRPGHWPPLAA